MRSGGLGCWRQARSRVSLWRCACWRLGTSRSRGRRPPSCDKASIVTTLDAGSTAQERNVGLGWLRGRLRVRLRWLRNPLGGSRSQLAKGLPLTFNSWQDLQALTLVDRSRVFRDRGTCNLLSFDVSIVQMKTEMPKFTSLIQLFTPIQILSEM